MMHEASIRPKDVGRLVFALLLAATAAFGLQLAFECAIGSSVGSLSLLVWLLGQWPFARLRLQLRRGFLRRRRNAYADYFQN